MSYCNPLLEGVIIDLRVCVYRQRIRKSISNVYAVVFWSS